MELSNHTVGSALDACLEGLTEEDFVEGGINRFRIFCLNKIVLELANDMAVLELSEGREIFIVQVEGTGELAEDLPVVTACDIHTREKINLTMDSLLNSSITEYRLDKSRLVEEGMTMEINDPFKALEDEVRAQLEKQSGGLN